MATRRSRYYDGTQVTTQQLSTLLSKAIDGLRAAQGQKPELVMGAWPEVIGPTLAAMTQPLSFSDGVLVVKVRNSTLHSLLSRHDKPRILKQLRQKFSQITIRNIIFRMG